MGVWFVVFSLIKLSDIVTSQYAISADTRTVLKNNITCPSPEIENGRYKIVKTPQSTVLYVTCDPEHISFENTLIPCINGTWVSKMPNCKRENLKNISSNGSGRKPCEISDIKFGSYKMENRSDVMRLKFHCEPEYDLLGPNTIECNDGVWSTSIPECVRTCKLKPDESVTYECLDGKELYNKYRVCKNREPVGTIVRSKCTSGHFYIGSVPLMRCLESGQWSFKPKCRTECGTVISNNNRLTGGPSTLQAKLGDAPWHASIYRNHSNKYRYQAAGSLVSTNIVLSSAYLFWDENKRQLLDVGMLAAVLGGIYRGHCDFRDKNIQRFDIADIILPDTFRGLATKLQEDIAVIKLAPSVSLNTFIKPVCLDFDVKFEKKQRKSEKGMSVGWGSQLNKKEPNGLNLVEIRCVTIPYCTLAFSNLSNTFPSGDKMCAYGVGELQNKTYLRSVACDVDIGSGYTFPHRGSDGILRYYLRGIASTWPSENTDPDVPCKGIESESYRFFTEVSKHESFLLDYLDY